MKKRSFLTICAAAFIAAVFLCFIGGCSEYERRGYSPIPQNRPASWEMRPYGDMRN